MKWIVGLIVSLAPVVAVAEPLELICRGTSVKTVEDSSSVTVKGADGASSSGSVSTTQRVRVEERYLVRLDGAGGASIKIPSSAIPTLRSGGKDGWWPVVDLTTTDDQIAGTYKMNIFNKGRFKIDRRTGDIELSSLDLTFSGACERAPEPTAERKF